MRALADRLGLPERSMGMSGDLEAAVAEGSTMVRIGTDLVRSPWPAPGPWEPWSKVSARRRPMASMWRRAMLYLGLGPDDEYDDYDVDDEPMPERRPAPAQSRYPAGAHAVPRDRSASRR